MDTLNHLLSHQLSTSELILIHHRYIQDVLNQSRIIPQCETEEGEQGPVMHRWNLRLNSLISPATASPLRTIAFDLQRLTFTASTTSLLDQGKASLSIALNVISSSKSDTSLFSSALDLIQFIFARSQWHLEWAREIVSAQVVQRAVNALVASASAQKQTTEIISANLRAIITLIPIFPTALRPLGPSIHNLATSHISSSSPFLRLGSELFATLYLLAPKGRDGLREAWRKSVESVIGTIDSLIPFITQDVFAEDQMHNHTLPTLALPSLPDSNSPLTVLDRIEALSSTLRFILRTPTTERVGSVEIPIGSLCELSIRLISLHSETPVKERIDPFLVQSIQPLLPKLQLIGCQLLGQISTCLGSSLSPHLNELLSTLLRTLSIYPARSPLRSMLTTTCSVLLLGCKNHVDPEEGKRSLARVWRVVLEDIGAIAVEPVISPSKVDSEAVGKGRKMKKQKTSNGYNPNEIMSLNGKRPYLDEIDLGIALQSLSTLNRLITLPFSHFLPSKLQLSTSRLLLYILHTYTTSPFPSTSTSSPLYTPSSKSLSNPLQIAFQTSTFIPLTLSALLNSLKYSSGAEGLIDQSHSIFIRLSIISTNQAILNLCREGVTWLEGKIHPSLAPPQIDSIGMRVRRNGKEVVGEVDEESVKEFGLKISEGDGEEEDDRMIDEEEEEERRRRRTEERRAELDELERKRIEKEQEEEKVRKQKAESRATVAFPTSVFGIPAFGSASKREEVMDEEEEEAVEVIEETQMTLETGPREVVAASSRSSEAQEDDSDSDDEAMPTINMESDDE